MQLSYRLQLNRDDSWHMDKPHFHDGYELLLSLSDAGSFFVENRLYPIRRGTLLLLDDAALHRSVSDGQSYERYVLHFPPQTLQQLSGSDADFAAVARGANRAVVLDEARTEELAALFQGCAADSGRFGDGLRRDISFLRLVLEAFSLFAQAAPPQPAPSADFGRAAPVLDYIREHLGERLTLDELAARFFISKHYLCRVFKAATGFGVGEYIVHSRVLRARALLREGLSVQEAGERAGFGSNAHFIRTFGELTGISPGRYAREYQNSEKK